MKGNDKLHLISILITAFIIGFIILLPSFDKYSDLITFLSIMIGFKITSLSIIFNSNLKRTLYDRKIPLYGTELHRIKYFYQSSIFFDTIAVVIIFLIPSYNYLFILKGFEINFGKYLIVLPILFGSIFCFYKLFKDLLEIFVYPTND